ncbi:MAG: hypothetical protein ACMUHY_00665, partial [Thermoplasmatota archaeon]
MSSDSVFKCSIMVVVILSLILISPPFVSSEEAELVGTEVRITSEIEDDMTPVIYGNRILWTKRTAWDSDVCMYDIETKEETRIASSDYAEYSPNIYEDTVVWVDTRHGNPDIYMYDLETEIKTRVSRSPDNDVFPSIHENKIVYTRMNDDTWNVILYDIDTREETELTLNITGDPGGPEDPDAYEFYPEVYGSKVVYAGFRYGTVDVFLYDLDNGTETRITREEDFRYAHSIYENRVLISGSDDIFLFDLETWTMTRITDDEYDAFACGIESPAVTDTRCDELEAAGMSFEARALNLPSIS